MATETIHEGVVNFQSGGTVVMAWGSDTLTVLNMVEGSLKWRPPGEVARPYSDNGIPQAPLRGPVELGMVAFKVRGVKAEANNLIALLSASNTGANTMKEGTITVKIPNWRESANGSVAVFSNCSSAKTPEFSAGTDFDEIDVEFAVRTWTPWTTY